jgi:TadE-like protein
MRCLGHSALLQHRRLRTALRARLSRLRDESGSALVELALTLSIVGVPLLMGTAHFAVLLIDSIVVSNAAHAGAEYGMQSSTFAGDTTFIQAAAQDDSGMGTNLTVTPTVFWACSLAIGGTQYTTAAAATTACTGSGNPLEFIKVVASAIVTPAAQFPGAANTVTLTSTSIMVVEE